jgi:hypothetical protein
MTRRISDATKFSSLISLLITQSNLRSAENETRTSTAASSGNAANTCAASCPNDCSSIPSTHNASNTCASHRRNDCSCISVAGTRKDATRRNDCNCATCDREGSWFNRKHDRCWSVERRKETIQVGKNAERRLGLTSLKLSRRALEATACASAEHGGVHQSGDGEARNNNLDGSREGHVDGCCIAKR